MCEPFYYHDDPFRVTVTYRDADTTRSVNVCTDHIVEKVYLNEDENYSRAQDGVKASELRHSFVEQNRLMVSKRSFKEMNRGYRGLNKTYFGRKGRNFKALNQ